MRYHYDRESRNGRISKSARTDRQKFATITRKFALDFADAIARFEEDYIFCWLDWDGDNIMMDGGIIDYGSIRLFGLFHHRYRFKDTAKWSTNIKEQRKYGRKTVQAFAQACDFAITGIRKPLENFTHCPYTLLFDHHFKKKKRWYLMRRIGLTPDQIDFSLPQMSKRVILQFEKLFYSMEQMTSTHEPVEVPDGITTPALLNMRTLLRELPQMLTRGQSSGDISRLLQLVSSTFMKYEPVSRIERSLLLLEAFLNAYLNLIRELSRTLQIPGQSLIHQIAETTSREIRPDRITGDAMHLIGEIISRNSERLGVAGTQRLIEKFLEQQLPSRSKGSSRLSSFEQKLLKEMIKLAHDYREGL